MISLWWDWDTCTHESQHYTRVGLQPHIICTTHVSLPVFITHHTQMCRKNRSHHQQLLIVTTYMYKGHRYSNKTVSNLTTSAENRSCFFSDFFYRNKSIYVVLCMKTPKGHMSIESRLLAVRWTVIKAKQTVTCWETMEILSVKNHIFIQGFLSEIYSSLVHFTIT